MDAKLNQSELYETVINYCNEKNLEVPQIKHSLKRCYEATKDSLYFYKTKNSKEKVLRTLALYEEICRSSREEIQLDFLKKVERDSMVEEIVESQKIYLKNEPSNILKIKLPSYESDLGSDMVILLDLKNNKFYQTSEKEYVEAL
jgi:uncharacterized protein (UPF0297 family)